MDRVFIRAKFALAFGILISAPVLAGTVLLPTQRSAPMSADEMYPESRFGHAPSKVQTGVFPGYAARAMEVDEDESDGNTTFGKHSAGGRNRGPASADQLTTSSASTESHEPLPSALELKRGVQEVALIAGDLGYFPRMVFVSRDVPVRMFVTGASKNTLCLMMDSFQIRKQIRSQKIEEITFTPNVPGKYRFYCPVNGMEGTLVVKEFASSAPGDAGDSGR